MSSLVTSAIVFACVFGGVLLGMLVRRRLPEHHLGADSKEAVRMGVGLVGTMAALVLGLLVASAKSSYDARGNELTQMSANVIFLDRILARYGPETKEIRGALRRAVAVAIERIWPEDSARPSRVEGTADSEAIYDDVLQLTPKNDAQRMLQAQALKVGFDLTQTRWLLFAQQSSSISTTFLMVLTFWLTILFASFGMFAPPNATVLVTLFISALSVSGALFLILELDRPFTGVIQISSEPLRNALEQLGR